MIRKIEAFILDNWNMFKGQAGEKPNKLDFIIRSGLFHSSQAVIFYAFRDKVKQPFCVCKFSNERGTNNLLEHEYDSITYLSDSLGPPLQDAIPRAYGHGMINGRFGFFLEYIDFDRLNTSKYLSFRSRKKDGSISQVIEWLVKFQHDTFSGYLDSRNEFMENYINKKCLIYEDAYPDKKEIEDKMFEALRNMDKVTGNIKLPIVSVHGDFCWQNLLIKGDRFKIIDWAYSSPKGMFYEDLFMLSISGKLMGNLDSGNGNIMDLILRMGRRIFDDWDIPLSHIRPLVFIFCLGMCIREYSYYGHGVYADFRWRTKLVEMYKEGFFEL